nr:tripartite tricarboxylate transporter substrate binding protein [Pigmentiphaga aceris]
MKTRIFVATLLFGMSAAALAQETYPVRPITVVVPFAPGGSSDMIARALSPKMSEKLGQQLVVENKPGATGAIGATFVKSAAPDGYTILAASIGVYSVNPHLQKKLAYDPSKDLDMLSIAVRAPNVLVVNPKLPVTSVHDLIAHLKKNPLAVSFGTSGAGTSDHLTTALFWQKTGTNGIHTPYKGGALVITDVMAGHLDASFQNINVTVQQIKSGNLKPLAITSEKRSPLLPDVPTLDELGIKDMNVYSWQAYAAPKGLPAAVKTKLHASIVAALDDPKLKTQLVDQGFELVGNSPEAASKFQSEELARWKKVIEVGGITVD